MCETDDTDRPAMLLRLNSKTRDSLLVSVDTQEIRNEADLEFSIVNVSIMLSVSR